jgi:hypothetical protein
MTTKNPDEATVRAAIERPMRMQTALAALPAASEAMRDELGRWMQMVTPTAGGAPTSDVKYGASTDAAMVTTTWRISAGVERIRPGLDKYFADFGADDGAAAFLDASLEMFQAQRAGIWIEMGNDAIDTGWYFDEPFDVTKVFAVAGGGGSLGEKARAWAEQNRVTRTAYVARSLGAKTPYHDIFMPVPTVDAALQLVSSFELAAPNPLVEDGLRRGAVETAGVSVRVTEKLVTRVGLLARRPSTDAVLSLIRTRDDKDARLLATFEGALGVNGATWAEYEIYSNRTNLELHYTLE